MAITLEQAKVTMHTPFEQAVYDEFRRGSLLLDRLTFDNAVSPGTGGSNLTYGYTQLKTPSMAQFREINQEYTPDHAVREGKSVVLKIFGGSYRIDRVIQQTSGQINEAAFQAEQKVKGAVNLFHHTVINGDTAVDEKSFDGLNKMLTGTSTELNTEGIIDLSSITDANKFLILEKLDDFLSELDGKPTMLMGNSKLINRIKAAARVAGYLTPSEDAFGRTIAGYDGIPLVDLEYYTDIVSGTPISKPIVPVNSRTVAEEEQSGLTDLYAVNIGLDGFHGVVPVGMNAGITSRMPNFNTPGVMKEGDVEMVAGVALKQSRKAGVLRNIKVS